MRRSKRYIRKGVVYDVKEQPGDMLTIAKNLTHQFVLGLLLSRAVPQRAAIYSAKLTCSSTSKLEKTGLIEAGA